jgi:hypothetical protein
MFVHGPRVHPLVFLAAPVAEVKKSRKHARALARFRKRGSTSLDAVDGPSHGNNFAYGDLGFACSPSCVRGLRWMMADDC